MKLRLENILEASIQEFIRTGRPISSSHLYHSYNFGIKPATIRLELEDLTDKGYLVQPYRSAGRIPSDAGYEFFIKKSLNSIDGIIPENRLGSLFRKSDWPGFLDLVSRRFRILGVISDIDGRVYKSGLEVLIDQLDWGLASELKSVIRDFESIDDRLDQVVNVLSDQVIEVFVGRKSPVTSSDYLSVVMGRCGCEYGKTALLAIGPKRMDYKKVIQMFRGINNIR